MTLVGWFWIIFAAAFALVGLILLARALFADRSRGRKRCPKCWYDLTVTTSLRCSECGREARNERQLYRTRRHWWAALLGVLLIVTGFGLFAGGEVHRDGWVRATPTVGYIAALPWLDQKSTLRELNNRVSTGKLRHWEYHVLVHRCIGVMRSSNDPQVLKNAIDLVRRVEFGARYSSQDKPWGSWLAASDIAETDAIDALAGLFDHSDRQVGMEAIDCVREFHNRGVRALPALLGQLVDSDDKVAQKARVAISMLDRRREGAPASLVLGSLMLKQRQGGGGVRELDQAEVEFCRAMKSAGADFQHATTVMTNSLSIDNDFVQRVSMYGLASLAADDPAVRAQILRRFDDADGNLKAMIVGATSQFPLDETVEKLLRQTLIAADEWSIPLQLAALRAVAIHGTEGKRFLTDVEGIVTALEPQMLLTEAVRCHQAIGGDPEVAVDALLARLAEAPAKKFAPDSRYAILDALGELRVDSVEARAVLEPLMSSDDAETRSAAATAYVRLNGPDLDAATRAIFEGFDPDTRRVNMPLTRWKWFARHGRISIPVVMERLASDQPVDRASAAEFLGESWHGGIPALMKLKELRDDPDSKVQLRAKDAIRRIEWARDHPEWRPSR